MDGQQWIDGYQARLAELGTRVAAASRELAAVSATASSPDGAARVTVDAAGGLQRVEFGPAAEPLGRDRLAAAVLAAGRRAQAQAAGQAAAVVAPLVGGGR